MNRELFLKAETTAQLVGRIVVGQVEPVGIPAFLLATLTHVRDHQPVTPTTVSSVSGVPVTTLRDNVQRLVDRGLVERRPNPDDGRSALLEVTKTGDRHTVSAYPALQGSVARVHERLDYSPRELDLALDRLEDAMRAVLSTRVEPSRPGGSTRRPGPRARRRGR